MRQIIYKKKKMIWKIIFCVFCVLFCLTLHGIKVLSNLESSNYSAKDALYTESSEEGVVEKNGVILDVSNKSEGYFLVEYIGNNSKVRVQIVSPDGSEKRPILNRKNKYAVLPLSNGSGHYTIKVLENITDDKYNVLLSEDIDVNISDEFKPFLYSNMYVDFENNEDVTEIGKKISKGTKSDLDVVRKVYDYMIKNFSYDKDKAKSVKDGYFPEPKETFTTNKGICFDFASAMACILRSQGIPTKLEIGYCDGVRHAWINVYTKSSGVVDGVKFKGSEWVRLDPTTKICNKHKDVSNFVKDDSNYVVDQIY